MHYLKDASHSVHTEMYSLNGPMPEPIGPGLELSTHYIVMHYPALRPKPNYGPL